jgi:tetratricopeptide (TPR) repeat protein
MILSLGLRKCGRIPVIVMILAAGVLAVVVGECTAAVPYRSYIYDYWSEAVITPNAYVPRMVVTGKDLGVGSFSSPSDLCVGPDGNVFVVDTGNNRIVILGSDFTVVGVIDTFDNQGTSDRFKGPRGVYVTSEGRVYVADTGNARVVELTSAGELVRVIGAPDVRDTGVVDEDFRYVPSKVAVDPIGRMYVLVEDEYDGLLSYTASGDFVGFVGAPRVTPSVADLFWQSISTREQRERSSLFLPTEYTNLDVDHKGLVLAVEANKIRRLNPSGQDVLNRSALNALKGYAAPQGDLRFPGRYDQGGLFADSATYTDRSSFTDIVSGPFGTYSALDGNRGRVFTYDEAGRLLYVFGGPGQQVGLVVNPVAIEMLGDLVLVLDRNTQAITVYEPTMYGTAILTAVGYYQTGRYDESMRMWETVLKFNTNYAMAYQGIGDALLRKGQYVDAMHYYRLGDDRIGYSEAFSYARKDAVNRWFGRAVAVAVALVLLASLARRARRSRLASESSPSRPMPASGLRAYMLQIGRSLRFAFHVIVSPLDGFWDLKHEQRGSAAAAAVILVLVTATYIFLRQYTGFVFNSRDTSAINIYTEAASVLLPFGLWCAVNWSLTTLMDGKGGIRDIYIATSYALVPLVIVYVPLTILSHFMTIEEGSLYNLLLVLALIWSGILLVVGNSVTHDYSAVAGVWTSVLTVAGMGLVLFISLLFFGLTNQLASFFTDLYTELMFRL